MKVADTYLFPNRMICTFDEHGKQIPELQGVCSNELFQKIFEKSDNKTNWNGFEEFFKNKTIKPIQ